MTTVDTLGQQTLQVGQVVINAFNAKDWARFRAAVAPDLVVEYENEQRSESADAFITGAVERGLPRAVPDVRATVRRSFACGDTAVFEVVWEGTHTGLVSRPEGDIPATGNRVRALGALIMRVRDNRLSEMHSYFDSLTFQKQTGMIRTPS
jgi:ketosteroid isomerase-like protein